MFSLVSARYERASLIVTSNKPFSAWGQIFGDEVVAAAMIDRLVHHRDPRPQRRQLPAQGQGPGHPATTGGLIAPARSASPFGLGSAGGTSSFSGATAQRHDCRGWSTFQPAEVVRFSTGVDMPARLRPVIGRARLPKHAHPSASAGTMVSHAVIRLLKSVRDPEEDRQSAGAESATPVHRSAAEGEPHVGGQLCDLIRYQDDGGSTDGHYRHVRDEQRGCRPVKGRDSARRQPVDGGAFPQEPGDRDLWQPACRPNAKGRFARQLPGRAAEADLRLPKLGGIQAASRRNRPRQDADDAGPG